MMFHCPTDVTPAQFLYKLENLFVLIVEVWVVKLQASQKEVWAFHSEVNIFWKKYGTPSFFPHH